MNKTRIKCCQMCAKPLGNKRRYYFINIEQNPPIHKFCSRNCKIKYIRAIQHSKKKLLKKGAKNQ